MNSHAYAVFKFIHIFGIVLLVGNVTITAVWKVFADRTRNSSIASFAQRLVIGTDWVFTGGGIVLIVVGGYGMVAIADLSFTKISWLVWGQAMFLLSGAIWLGLLIPLQQAQARLLSSSEPGHVPESYWRLGHRWLFWGVAATVPLVVAMYLMIAKP